MPVGNIWAAAEDVRLRGAVKNQRPRVFYLQGYVAKLFPPPGLFVPVEWHRIFQATFSCTWILKHIET